MAHVARRPLEVVHLRHAAGEVLEALGGAAPRKRLVAAVQPERGAVRGAREATGTRGAAARPRPLWPRCPLLWDSLGVGLLQQSAPELGALRRVHEQELPVLGGQQVIHHHVHPLAELPDLGGEGRGEQDGGAP